MKANLVHSWKLGAVAAALAVLPAAAQAAPAVPSGFTVLFDGKTLNGWKGDPKVWTVQDGAITAGDGKAEIPRNTFLIHEKPYGNFELRYKYRWLTEEGNSGFQFRSAQAWGDFTMVGYQANITPLGIRATRPERFGMLYAELTDKQEMALLGQKVEITRRTAGNGGTARIVRTVKEMANSRDDILNAVKPTGEWNEVVVIAYGNRIVSAINGLVAFDALDNDPSSPASGVFGIQAHSGPPMQIQFKDVAVKPLKSTPNFAAFKSSPTSAPEPVETYKDSTRAGQKDVALPAE